MATFTVGETNKSSDSILLGLGRVGLRTYPLGSPAPAFSDLGYIKGMGIELGRELKDFESAGALVKRIVFRDTMKATIQLAQTDISILSQIIPGTTSGGSPPTRITFGGNRAQPEYALRFEHMRTDTKIVRVDMYRTVAGGTVTLNYAEEEFITYPAEFNAQLDTTKPPGQQYGSIELISV